MWVPSIGSLAELIMPIKDLLFSAKATIVIKLNRHHIWLAGKVRGAKPELVSDMVRGTLIKDDFVWFCELVV